MCENERGDNEAHPGGNGRLDGADRAVDYAAHWAKSDGASLPLVNLNGGHGLPDRMVRSFTYAQHAWLDDPLAAFSAVTLNEARVRACDRRSVSRERRAI